MKSVGFQQYYGLFDMVLVFAGPDCQGKLLVALVTLRACLLWCATAFAIKLLPGTLQNKH